MGFFSAHHVAGACPEEKDGEDHAWDFFEWWYGQRAFPNDLIPAEAFGQEAGNAVHHSSWFSLVPYVPAILGVILLGHWLREDRHKRPVAPASGTETPL